MLDLSALPLWLVVVLFLGGGALVWQAGARLARSADEIAEQTSLSHAFVGALMLGGITSLPEAATTLSSTLIGNVDLAVNNALGSSALQITLLAVADIAARDVILSAACDRRVIRVATGLLVALLTLAALGALVGEPPGWPVGVWSMALLVGAGLAFAVIHRFDDDDTPVRPDRPAAAPAWRRRVAAKVVLAALVVLVGGSVVAVAGNAIGERTTLGSRFVGVLFTAAANSLPELSTTLAAVRLGRSQLAFSNLVGANFFNVALIGVIDLIARDGPVLNHVGRFSAFAALLGALLAGIYLLSLLRGRHRRVGWIGLDSLLVMLVYLGGIALLFRVRG